MRIIRLLLWLALIGGIACIIGCSLLWYRAQTSSDYIKHSTVTIDESGHITVSAYAIATLKDGLCLAVLGGDESVGWEIRHNPAYSSHDLNELTGLGIKWATIKRPAGRIVLPGGNIREDFAIDRKTLFVPYWL